MAPCSSKHCDDFNPEQQATEVKDISHHPSRVRTFRYKDARLVYTCWRKPTLQWADGTEIYLANKYVVTKKMTPLQSNSPYEKVPRYYSNPWVKQAL